MLSASDRPVWERSFTVTSREGHRLACLLTGPSLVGGAAAPPPGTPVVVLCHGYTGGKRNKLLAALAAHLVHAGHVVARLDFSANGASTGVFRYSNYAGEADELRALIEELRRDGRFKVCAIVGHSKGAGVVLLYGQKYNDVDRIVNLAGRWRMERGMHALFGPQAMATMESGAPVTVTTTRVDGDGNFVPLEYQMTWEQVQERAAMDMAAAVEVLKQGTRVLTVHGDQDEIIPVEDGRELNEAVREGEMVEIEGANHSFVGFEGRVAEAILQFLVR